MIPADITDRSRAVDILADAFDNNKSVNYIVRQGGKRKQRVRRLMKYSFDVCLAFGKVFFSDDKNACALLLLPDKKKTTLRSVRWDVKLALTCIGLGNIRKAMRREAKIKALQPKEPFCYLWFIGVSPSMQGNGIGSSLLKEVLDECGFTKRMICLETSTLKNIPWYEKFGFTIYNQLDLGYRLFFLKKD